MDSRRTDGRTPWQLDRLHKVNKHRRTYHLWIEVIKRNELGRSHQKISVSVTNCFVLCVHLVAGANTLTTRVRGNGMIC